MGNAQGSIQRYQSSGDNGALIDALKQLDARGGAGGPTGNGFFIFRPGVPSTGNAYATEDELFSAIAQIEAPEIAVDLSAYGGPFTITRDWPMRGGAIFSVYPNTGVYELVVPEPFQLVDCLAVARGIGVRFNRTATPGVAYTDALNIHIFAINAGAVVYVEGTYPSLPIVAAGFTQVVSMNLSGSLRILGAAPFVRVQAGASAIATLLASSRNLNAGFGDGWVDGPNGSNVGYVSVDASFETPAIPGFLGTVVVENLIDRAASMQYTDTAPLLIPSPPLEGPTVQAAIDELKRRHPPSVASFYGNALLGLLNLTNSIVPPGFGATTQSNAGLGGPCILAVEDGTLSSLIVSHVGDPANPPGSQITYTATRNGIAVTNLLVTLAADAAGVVTGTASTSPPEPYVAGDRIRIVATVSTGGPPALTASVTEIAAGLGA